MVRFGNRKAILRWGEWCSADAELERELNESTTTWIRETGGPSLKDRDPERTVAMEMARRHKGRLAMHIKSRQGKSTQRFVEMRQMVIEFPSFSPANTRKPRRQPGAGAS